MTTMATMKFEQFMEGKCEYLRCFLAGGGVCEGSEAHLSLSRKVLAVAAKQLHFVGSVDSTTASRWVDIVRTSMLTPADKHGLIIHLNDKVDLEESVDDHNPGSFARVRLAFVWVSRARSGGAYDACINTEELAEACPRAQIPPQLRPRAVVDCYL